MKMLITRPICWLLFLLSWPLVTLTVWLFCRHFDKTRPRRP